MGREAGTMCKYKPSGKYKREMYVREKSQKTSNGMKNGRYSPEIEKEAEFKIQWRGGPQPASTSSRG
jgi:hypothetical protein